MNYDGPDVLVKRRWGHSIVARWRGRKDPTDKECFKSGYFFRKHLVKVIKTSDPAVTLEFCRRCKLVGPRL